MNLFHREPDRERANLEELGYRGSIGDMQYNFLKDLNLSGSLNDMKASYLEDDFEAFGEGDEDILTLGLEIGINL